MLRSLPLLAAVALSAAMPAAVAVPVAAAPAITEPWPQPSPATAALPADVHFPSASPFGPAEVLAGDAPPTVAEGILYEPPDVSRAAPHSVPAVVLLHGAAGFVRERAATYGLPLAAMGIATLAVDSFASRPQWNTGFNERLLRITETMLVADAYAALRYLAGRPEIDPRRVVLVGFSYGGMASTFALYRQLADHLVPPGLRFAGHASFYAPCIARFSDPRTTGAPMLMLRGAEDMITPADRCDQVAADLRTGGSAVAVRAIPGAVHEWDGPFGRRMIGHDLSPCRFVVARDGTIGDALAGLPMTGPMSRELDLYLCVNARPYPIGHDDAAVALSNRLLGQFLASTFHIPDQS